MLTSCASSLEGERPGRELRIGISYIDHPTTPTSGLVAYRVSTLGAGGSQSGGFLGWRATEAVIADPEVCELVVIVRSNVEAEHAAKILRSLKGERLCAANFSQ
ncbi:MAG: hypothetical protein WDM79_08320 [Terricaulis sp.]